MTSNDIQQTIRQAIIEAEQLLTARDARRAAIRSQILADQASGSRRDAKALEREREWFEKNGGRK